MFNLSKNALGMLASKYRAVLKNMRFKGVGFLAACFFVTLAPAGALAADIIYDGSDPGMLKTTPYWHKQWADSLFPFDNGTLDPLASGNMVTVYYDPTPGLNPSYVFGGLSQDVVTGNIVNILNGYIDNDVYGGYSTENRADDNTAIILGGQIGGNVYGGYSQDFLAINNNVFILDQAEVDGDVYGGYSESSSVASNVVNILDDAVVRGNIYGGYSNGASTSPNHNDANYNEVHILGGTFDETTIYGGYSTAGDAKENTVIIAGSPILNDIDIYGGSSGRTTADTFTGNTLIVAGVQATASINDFQDYGFILPASMKADATLLQTGSWKNSSNEDITVDGIGIESGGTPLKPGETVKLIGVTSSLGSGDFPENGLSSDIVIGQKGISLLYKFKLEMNETEQILSATVDSVEAHPQTKALAEGRLATMGFLNRGADLIAGEGISDALLKLNSDAQGAFGALSYGSSRYKTGSHADVEGVNLLTGIAWKRQMEKSSLLTGIFLEGGWGNYNTYNSFTNLPSINSNGDASYYGLGVLARRDLASGSYVEGSVRGGKSKTAFNSSDFLDNMLKNINVSYTSKPAYYGAHIGIGRVQASGGKSVDYYAKYFYTHQSGDDITVEGDTLSFSSSDSNRLRGGVRLTNKRPDSKIATYYGAAYEYEFNGKAKGTAYGYDIDAPSLKGGVGILELGINWKKSPDSASSLNLTLQGYMGKRQGLAGVVEFKRLF